MGKLDTIIKKIIDGTNISKQNRANKKPGTSNKVVQTRHPLSVPELKQDIHELVRQCREEIQKSEDSGIMPAPTYFEQVAILSRKEKKYENEIAICEMYIDLINQYAEREKLTKDEISTNLLPNCTPFMKRLHNAKIMISHE